MLKSLNSLLTEVNAQPHHKRWIKYYKKNFVISKDFNSTLPSLVKFNQIFPFKEIDSTSLKKTLLNIKSNPQNNLDIELAKLLKIDTTPIPEEIEELCKEAAKIQMTKSNEKQLNLVFDCITRYFICFSYQFDSTFLAGKIIVSYVPSFVQFYLRYQKHQRFVEDVLILFKYFLNKIVTQWDSIFNKLEAGCQQQIDLINIMRHLIPISKASIEESKDNGFFDTISKQSFSIFQDIEPKRFSSTISDSIYQIFTWIVDLIPIVDSKEMDLLCSIASSVLSMIPKFSLLDDAQKYQLGSLFLKIYSYPVVTLSDETAKQQFNVIINYVLWIVFTFHDKRMISVDYEESMNKTELQPIGVSEYFRTVKFIPTGEPLISNQYLAQSAQMLNQMIQQSNYKSLLMSLLISAMDNNQKKMEIEQYQSFSAFVLYVIHKCSDQALAAGFSNYWNVLISEALFPEQNGFDDRNLRDTILKIFMRCFIAVPSSRSVILTAISEYFTKHRINELRYFLPLFNNLLALDQDIKFAQELIKSPLMNFLLTESKQYLEIFDLIRHVMFLHSRSCFESRTILKFCFDCVKVPLYRESMIKCLENALITCTKEDDAQHVVSSLICEISSSIQSLLKSDIDLANQFVLILVQSMKTFRHETIPTLFIASTFEILSQAVLEIDTTEIFELVLSVFIELCQKNNSVYQYFLNKECQVYTYLTNYIKKANSEYNYGEILFNFAFLNSDKNDKKLIKNYHAVPLILEWAKNKSFENEIYSKIFDICKESSANVYELVKADIFTFIINQIKSVGFNEKTDILFKIYSRIASFCLPNSAYFDTLKLISLPIIDCPEKFISLFNSFFDQLKDGHHFYCSSFFHFEQPSDGISGPSSFHFGNKFSFCTILRSKYMNSEKPLSLLKMISDKKDVLEFNIVNSQITMNQKSPLPTTSNNDNILENSPNSNISTTFSIKLNNNNEIENSIELWNRIVIIVDGSQVTLCIDDNIEQSKVLLNPFQNTDFTIRIGNGFNGDLSDIYFLNEVNIEKINNNDITNKSILCQYIPRNVRENTIINVCKSQVNFYGQSVLYVNTIQDIIKNESSIMNLLPIFVRFASCTSCILQNSSQRCNVCGSFEINEGFDFLEKLMKFISTASLENAIYMTKKHFFSILSYYFERMNHCYFTTRFYNILLSCFEQIKNKQLAQEMVESIFQNYDLITKYSNEKQIEYFSEIIPKAYSIQKEVFHSYRQFNFLIFLAIAYYPEETDISKNLWRSILTILPNRTDYASYTLLLAIPMFHHYNFSSEMIFTCFEKMIDDQNPFFLKALESMEYFTPFTYIFKYPQIRLQLQAFRIISKLRKKCETSDLIRAIYQIIEYYQPSEDSIKLLNFANSIFLEDNGPIENAEYFPLIVTISSYVEKEEAFPTFENIMHSIYDYQAEAMKITTEVFNWPYWLLKYIIQFYDDVNENTLSKFSLPFATLIEAQILSLKLQYQEIFIQIMTVCSKFNIKSRDILKEIFLYLFTQGQSTLSLSGPDLFKDAFVFIFFNDIDEGKRLKISPKPNQSSSLNRFCWYDEQSIVNYYFTIRTQQDAWIDQQLAESIADKIVLFSNINVEIYNESYNGLLLVTYILIILMRFKSQLAITLINEILIDQLNQSDQEIAQKCASYILRTRDCMVYETENKQEIEEYLNQIDFDQLLPMTTFYVDKEDSTSFQLFLFENSLYKNTKEMNELMTKVQTNYINESNKFTSFVLNIDANSVNSSSSSSSDKNEEHHYYSSSTVSYSNLMVIYADLLNSQDFYFTNAKYYRKQVADSFLKENFVLTNDNANININFKAMNNISRKGRRVLMSINYNRLNHNSISKGRRSRFSSASFSDTGKIDTTIVRHNQIHLSNILNENTTTSNSSKNRDNGMFKEIVDLLTPRRFYHGELVIVGNVITFDGTDSSRSKHIEINLDNILFIMKRTYGRFRKAVEVFTDINRSYYFVFACSYNPLNKTKNKKIQNSSNYGSMRHNFNAFVASKRSNNFMPSSQDKKYDFFNDMITVYGSIYQKKKKGNFKYQDLISKLEITERWQRRKMSNYEYLYYLNILAGRSFNDLSKYPIFPIVLLDRPIMDRKSFDSNNEDSYRNLGHPVGALKPDKLKKLLNRFKSVEDMQNKYFYSSMFSNPIIVSNLLSNVEPFASIYANLVYRKSLNVVLPIKVTDNEVKDDDCIDDEHDESSEVDFELTPEFFSFPSVFGEVKSKANIRKPYADRLVPNVSKDDGKQSNENQQQEETRKGENESNDANDNKEQNESQQQQQTENKQSDEVHFESKQSDENENKDEIDQSNENQQQQENKNDDTEQIESQPQIQQENKQSDGNENKDENGQSNENQQQQENKHSDDDDKEQNESQQQQHQENKQSDERDQLSEIKDEIDQSTENQQQQQENQQSDGNEDHDEEQTESQQHQQQQEENKQSDERDQSTENKDESVQQTENQQQESNTKSGESQLSESKIHHDDNNNQVQNSSHKPENSNSHQIPKLPQKVPSFSSHQTTIKPPFYSLPSWTTSPYEFININRRSLESDTTTGNLHKWIDLIFGCNRCSPSNLNAYRPILYPENSNDNLTSSENDQIAIESGLYPIQLFTKNHPAREQASLLPLEQVITSTPSNSLFNSLQGVVIKYESKKPALRIRKNFLITEDLQVVKFAFTSQAKMNQIQGHKVQQGKPKSNMGVQKPHASHAQAVNPLSQAAKQANAKQPQSPQSNSYKTKKALQLQQNQESQVQRATSDNSVKAGSNNDQLVHTSLFSVPDVPEGFNADIIEVSRSLMLLAFGMIGDSSISICDLRRCKEREGKESSNTSGGSASNSGKQSRLSSDLEDKSINPSLAGFTAEDLLVFNSLSSPASQKSKKSSKLAEDLNESKFRSNQPEFNAGLKVASLLVPPNSDSNSSQTNSNNNNNSSSNNSSNYSSAVGVGVDDVDETAIAKKGGFSVIHDVGQFNALKIVRFENAAVQCACISGGSILTVGLSDGTIRVFQLPNLSLIHTSSYHNRSVVSVSSNRELGLLVSVDDQYRLIFELLYEQRFIRAQKLSKMINEEIERRRRRNQADSFESSASSSSSSSSSLVFTAAPLLAIFKSGTVCAIVNHREENLSFIVFFNSRGDFRGFLEIQGIVKEFDKYYDFDSREILIVAVEPRKIMMIDVSEFEVLSASTGSFGQLRFCSVKYLRAIMYGNGRITQTLPFSFTQKSSL